MNSQNGIFSDKINQEDLSEEDLLVSVGLITYDEIDDIKTKVINLLESL